LITGIADAQIDSTPLVCITGQVPSNLLGTDAFQETDVIGISMPVTKWNYQITDASEIPEIMAKAFYIAKSGRPGPVVVDITKDAQFASMEFEYRKCSEIRTYHPLPVIKQDKLKEAADLINGAKQPFLLVGQGVLISKAQEALRRLIEKAQIPSAWTILGLSAMDVDHPLNVGMLGMHGNYAPNVLTNECDVLIAVGMRFDDRVTGDLNHYAKQAKVIHIEIDPSEIDKNVKAHVPLVGDAKQVLEALFPLVKENQHQSWLARFKELHKVEEEKIITPELYPKTDGIRMGEVVRLITEATRGEAIVVTDVGQHQMVTSRYYGFKKPHSSVTSGGLGTMGFALPAAMGAKVGQPDRTVVAVIGDGGFQMTLQELGTIFQYGIPVKIVILNNSFLGMVRQWQQLFFDRRYSFTEMKNPDFAAIGRGFSIESERVEDRAKLAEAVPRMLDYEGAYLLEVIVEKEENVFPMVPSGAPVSAIRME
jgi:acetolactate synthase-1/2/3 large subunit